MQYIEWIAVFVEQPLALLPVTHKRVFKILHTRDTKSQFLRIEAPTNIPDPKLHCTIWAFKRNRPINAIKQTGTPTDIWTLKLLDLIYLGAYSVKI